MMMKEVDDGRGCRRRPSQSTTDIGDDVGSGRRVEGSFGVAVDRRRLVERHRQGATCRNGRTGAFGTAERAVIGEHMSEGLRNDPSMSTHT